MPVATMRTSTSSERGASSSSSRSSNGADFSSTTAVVMFILATPNSLVAQRMIGTAGKGSASSFRRAERHASSNRCVRCTTNDTDAMRLATVHGGSGTFAAALSTAGAHPVLDAAGERVRDVGALLAAPASWRERAQVALARDAEPFEDADLRRPILEPGAVIAVGLNYASHIREMGREL